MFETLAGIYMATKVHFAQMKYPFIKRKDRVVAEEIYKNKVVPSVPATAMDTPRRFFETHDFR